MRSADLLLNDGRGFVSEDILSGDELETQLQSVNAPGYSLIALGDTMLGERTNAAIGKFGRDYPCKGVAPLLRRSSIVLANLEGPVAKEAAKRPRRYSYRVDPQMAGSMRRANINVLTLANNHLMDCGSEGVLETLGVLAGEGLNVIGAGADMSSAHCPAILPAGSMRIGMLGYYWNSRCAATRQSPGCAVDSPEWLEADIRSLKSRVDRVVVAFHWGIPYETVPLAGDQIKARQAIDFGADVVVAHHPHVIQPFEIYGGRPIFYSIGNFAFGSGNSRAEGLLVAFRFEELETLIDLYPLYVKNRDIRVDYQPKVLRGGASRNVLLRLAEMSKASGSALEIGANHGTIRLART